MFLRRLALRLQHATLTLPMLGIALLFLRKWLWSLAAFGGGFLLWLLLGALAGACSPAAECGRDERGNARPNYK